MLTDFIISMKGSLNLIIFLLIVTPSMSRILNTKETKRLFIRENSQLPSLKRDSSRILLKSTRFLTQNSSQSNVNKKEVPVVEEPSKKSKANMVDSQVQTDAHDDDVPFVKKILKSDEESMINSDELDNISLDNNEVEEQFVELDPSNLPKLDGKIKGTNEDLAQNSHEDHDETHDVFESNLSTNLESKANNQRRDKKFGTGNNEIEMANPFGSDKDSQIKQNLESVLIDKKIHDKNNKIEKTDQNKDIVIEKAKLIAPLELAKKDNGNATQPLATKKKPANLANSKALYGLKKELSVPESFTNNNYKKTMKQNIEKLQNNTNLTSTERLGLALQLAKDMKQKERLEEMNKEKKSNIDANSLKTATEKSKSYQDKKNAIKNQVVRNYKNDEKIRNFVFKPLIETDEEKNEIEKCKKIKDDEEEISIEGLKIVTTVIVLVLGLNCL